MKLSPVMTKQTLDQLDAQAVPDNNPAMPRLNELFGDHTFFIGDNGLHIVEPADSQAGEPVGRVLKVASWSDEEHTALRPHEPETTEATVSLREPERDQ
ncbi:MAG: hypothetical protein ACREFD_12755 [Stellaceae bacterium]